MALSFTSFKLTRSLVNKTRKFQMYYTQKHCLFFFFFCKKIGGTFTLYYIQTLDLMCTRRLIKSLTNYLVKLTVMDPGVVGGLKKK